VAVRQHLGLKPLSIGSATWLAPINTGSDRRRRRPPRAGAGAGRLLDAEWSPFRWTVPKWRWA